MRKQNAAILAQHLHRQQLIAPHKARVANDVGEHECLFTVMIGLDDHDAVGSPCDSVKWE
ncbi:hypothetical protein [Cellvibrio sp. UBA7661]|uniref:hypothetical protein n=1 Tax=Cellvibrio sp. UBA7661 TaxID=1946311 RepID=UPI002F35FF68